MPLPPTSRDTPAPDAPAWHAWRTAAADPAVDAALRGLYARLDADIAARGPTCWQSGKCCKFDAYGHRLYVTALEVAWFVGQVRGVEAQDSEDTPAMSGGVHLPLLTPTPEPRHPIPERDACPYQINNRCTTHTIRPLGCRIFFCQEGTQDWQHDLYERYLDELGDLHEAHGVDYRYADWLALLGEAAHAD